MKRLLCTLALVLGAALAAIRPAQGAPMLRLLWVANTCGVAEACRVCGNAALGGLDRRASLLRRLVSAPGPALVLAGPHEFLGSPALDAMRIERGARQVPLAALRAAYDGMPLDAGFVTPDEAAAFRAGTGLPRGFVELGAEPVVRRVQVGGVRLALVAFPVLADADGRVPAPVLEAALAAGRREADADLVVGISAWGFTAEGDSLQRLDGVVDVLLGAGAGAPFPLDVTAFAPGVAWSRSDRDGRYVLELRFEAAPGAARPHLWVRGADVSAREWPLDNTVPRDACVAGALAPRP